MAPYKWKCRKSVSFMQSTSSYTNCNTVQIPLVASPYKCSSPIVTIYDCGKTSKDRGPWLLEHVFSKIMKFILKDRVPSYRNHIPSSQIWKKKNAIAMNAIKHNRGRCYALLWGENCALSHCKTLPEEIAKVKIGMYCKRYTRVFVNPSKPFAHALLGIMICSCWELYLSYVCIWQPW